MSDLLRNVMDILHMFYLIFIFINSLRSHEISMCAYPYMNSYTNSKIPIYLHEHLYEISRFCRDVKPENIILDSKGYPYLAGNISVYGYVHTHVHVSRVCIK